MVGVEIRMKRIKPKYIIVLLIITFCLLYSLAIHQTFSIKNHFTQWNLNEAEVISTSEELIGNTLFSKDGIYSIYISSGNLKVDKLDWTGIKKEELSVSDDSLKRLFEKKWIDKNAIIEIGVYDANSSNPYTSVTYKYSFFCGHFVVWLYYGDISAFPNCPDSSAYKNNISKLSEQLYFAQSIV